MRIYVGNFVYETTEEQLREMFEEHGGVGEVSVVRDQYSGRSKGFGFVDMSSNDEANKAIEGLNGKEIGGRALTVSEARPRTPRTFDGGGGGGFSRSGGGGGGGGDRGGRRGSGPRW